MTSDNVMNVDDIMSGSAGKCNMKIDGSRYCLFNIRKFKGEVDTIKKERGLLGVPKKVTYVAGWKGTWTATVDFNTSVFARLMQYYKDTGHFPDMEITTENKNFRGSTGALIVMYREVTLDKAILSMFDVENQDGMEQDISGTFGDFEIPQGFNDMPGFRI